MSDAFVDAVRNNLNKETLSNSIIEATANGNTAVTVSIEIPLAEAAALLVTKQAPKKKSKRGGGAGRPPAIVSAVKDAKGMTTDEAKTFVKNNPVESEKILQEKKDSKVEKPTESAKENVPNESAEDDDDKAIEALANS